MKSPSDKIENLTDAMLTYIVQSKCVPFAMCDAICTKMIDHLVRHPRVSYQQLLSRAAEIATLKSALPCLTPFPGKTYHDALAIIDWDHRLPSVQMVLRVFTYYSAQSWERGSQQLARRTNEINEGAKFPEFDIPDYSDLHADEAYQADVDRSGKLGTLRLVSEWRRQITTEKAYTAIEIARQSAEFRGIAARAVRERESHLGDLEAISWTPPCESGHPSWTLDVWYMTELQATRGKGFSFLVDVNQLTVVATREFIVRS